METRRERGMVLFCALCIFVLAPAGLSGDADAQLFPEDLTLHINSVRSEMPNGGSKTFTSTEYYSRNAMKIAPSDGDQTIIQFDSEKIISIDNDKKTYSETTFEQMQEALKNEASEWSQQSGQMQAARKSLGVLDAPGSFTKVGSGETIAGYSTEEYLIKEGAAKVEIFAAPSLKMPAAYYDVLKMRLHPSPVVDGIKLYDWMKQMEGIPLKTVTNIKIKDNDITTTRVVTSIDKEDLPASLFEIPQGYARVEAN